MFLSFFDTIGAVFFLIVFKSSAFVFPGSFELKSCLKYFASLNKRGGRVKLQSIVMPLSEFEHVDKGDALYGMELALSLEKLVNEKLLNLHSGFLHTHLVWFQLTSKGH